MELAVRRLLEERPADLLELFGSDVVLVPAPRSAPFPEGLDVPLRGTKDDFRWVPRRICQCLVASGFASNWEPLLERRKRVTRSSTAAAAERVRPAAHIASMACSSQLSTASRFLVVDDFVTRGATLLACASLLQAFYPAAEVRGFGLERAVSNPIEFRAILDPVVGSIVLRPSGDTIRRP